MHRDSHDSLHVSVSFLNNPELQQLAGIAHELRQVTLGRVIALAFAPVEHHRVRFTYDEIDVIAGWRDEHSVGPYFYFLARVGWAKNVQGPGLAELTLPVALQPLNAKRLAGRARSKSAERDESGRFKPGGKAQPPNRTRAEIDAEGDVVAARKVRGGKAVSL